MIYWDNVIYSSTVLFYKEPCNIKQTLSSNNFTNYVVDEQIKLVNEIFKKITAAPSVVVTKIKAH